MRRFDRKWKGILQRIACCLLASCLLSGLIPPAAVRADVLIELDDKFWEKNYRDCSHTSRQYTVNSPEGYAVLWKSPVSTSRKEVVINGEMVAGDWHYTDENGETWCAVRGEMQSNGKDGVRGWIKTSECLAVPDYISFREAYEQEFVEYDPAYDHAFDGVDTVTLWQYPCSGVVAADHMSAQWFQDAESPGQMVSVCWKDPKGRMWGYIGYLYGMRNVWICLDDPAGDTLGTEEDLLMQDEVIYPPVDPDETDPQGEDEKITDVKKKLQQDVVVYPPAENPPKVKNGVTWLAIALVTGVVALTGGMIWFFFGRKKKEKHNTDRDGAGPET